MLQPPASEGGLTGAFERVQQALERCVGPCVRKRGTEYRYFCPVHEAGGATAGHEPSLDISWKNGTVVLVCRSRRCPTVEMLDVIGLNFRDLYDRPRVRR